MDGWTIGVLAACHRGSRPKCPGRLTYGQQKVLRSRLLSAPDVQPRIRIRDQGHQFLSACALHQSLVLTVCAPCPVQPRRSWEGTPATRSSRHGVLDVPASLHTRGHRHPREALGPRSCAGHAAVCQFPVTMHVPCKQSGPATSSSILPLAGNGQATSST